MNKQEFKTKAKQAGFNPNQIKFLWGIYEELGYEPGEENDSEEDDEEDI